MPKLSEPQLFDVLLVAVPGQEEVVYGPCDASSAVAFVTQWLVDPLNIAIVVRPSKPPVFYEI